MFYRDFNYVKANNNKKSNLYNIVDIEARDNCNKSESFRCIKRC